MYPFKETAKQFKKDFKQMFSVAKEFFDLDTSENFQDFIRSNHLLAFPPFLEPSESMFSDIIVGQRKTALIYLHDRGSGTEYLRSVMSSPEIVDLIQQNFVFFADFQDSSKGKKIIKLLNASQPFVLALFSDSGLISSTRLRGSLAETLEFLTDGLRPGLNNFHMRQNPKNRFVVPGHQKEDSFDKELQEALKRSREEEKAKQEELQWFQANGREELFDQGQDDDLQKILELSRIEHEKKLREDELFNRKILESQAELIQPYLDEDDEELNRALEISKSVYKEEQKHRQELSPRFPPVMSGNDSEFDSSQLNRTVSDRDLSKSHELAKGSALGMSLDEGRGEEEKKNYRKQDNIKEKMKKLGDEPGIVPNTCIVKFVLPNGQRLERRFYVDSDHSELYYFIESKGFENFDLVAGFPAKIIREGTLESNGLKAGGLCYIKPNF